MDRYRVRVRRDPDDRRFWLATIEGLDTLDPSARSLATLRRHVREVIVLAADLPDNAEPTIDWVYETGDAEADANLRDLRLERERLDAELARLAASTEEFARHLVLVEQYPVREAAILLGISSARVGQLTSSASSRKSSSKPAGRRTRRSAARTRENPAEPSEGARRDPLVSR